MDFLIIQIVSGVALAMLLFLVAAGLSLIFGLMDVVNIAHGAFYVLGAYVGWTVIDRTGSFMLGVVTTCALIALVGAAMQRGFLYRVPGDHLAQILMTFGFMLFLSDLALVGWAGRPVNIPVPEPLAGFTTVAGVGLPIYRVFVIAAGIVVFIGMWLILERTRVGALIRAGVDDAEMLRATVGVNIKRLFTAVFAFGAALAGGGGVLGGVFLGVYPGIDLEIVLLAFVVVIIGGVGSLKGTFLGSLLVGLIDTVVKAFLPAASLFAIFVLMVIVLVARPSGLFGERL